MKQSQQTVGKQSMNASKQKKYKKVEKRYLKNFDFFEQAMIDKRNTMRKLHQTIKNFR